MRKILFATFLLAYSHLISAQEKAIEYIKIQKFDSLSKNELFDRALIWCSKSFNDSKSAINVKERDGGLIGGKGTITFPYYTIIKNGKEMNRNTFGKLYFDWTIEVKDEKIRFSVINIYADMDQEPHIQITENPICPYKNPFIKQETLEKEWQKIKELLLNKLDLISLSLLKELSQKKPDW